MNVSVLQLKAPFWQEHFVQMCDSVSLAALCSCWCLSPQCFFLPESPSSSSALCSPNLCLPAGGDRDSERSSVAEGASVQSRKSVAEDRGYPSCTTEPGNENFQYRSPLNRHTVPVERKTFSQSRFFFLHTFATHATSRPALNFSTTSACLVS